MLGWLLLAEAYREARVTRERRERAAPAQR